jgi:hypothetical protein
LSLADSKGDPSSVSIRKANLGQIISRGADRVVPIERGKKMVKMNPIQKMFIIGSSAFVYSMLAAVLSVKVAWWSFIPFVFGPFIAAIWWDATGRDQYADWKAEERRKERGY